MRKCFFLLVLLCSCFALQAQKISSSDSVILRQILLENKKYTSLKSGFRHDLIKNGTTNHRYGELYYERVKATKSGDVPAKISMLYSDPKGEYYVITTTHLYNGMNGHSMSFNYKFISLMKLLGSTVGRAFNGDVMSIYNSMNLNMSVTSDSKNYIVTLTGGKGFNKGISKMVMKYSRTNGLIDYLEIVESLGTVHRYYMGIDANGKYTEPQINVAIDPAVFVVK